MWQNYVTEIVSEDVHKILFVLISKNVSSISVWRWEVTKTLKNIPKKFFAHFCYNFWRGRGIQTRYIPLPWIQPCLYKTRVSVVTTARSVRP